jgi:endonuclease/exonuclease/phosphatase (EEP) superfamily protein YafD
MARVLPREPRTLPARPRRRLVAVLVPGVLLAILPHVSLEGSRILAVLQALLPLWFLAALAVCLVLALRRALAPAAVLLILAAVSILPATAPILPATVPMAATPCTPGAQLSVVSLNAGRGHADPAALAAVIENSNPDVLVLVEASEPMIKALAAGLPAWDYTHRTGPVLTGGAIDTVILSRYPLRQETAAALQSEGALFDIPVAVIDHPRAGSIRIAGIHPAPPTHAPTSWAQTLRRLEAWTAGQADMPLVLAGDFNATAAHPQFRALAAGLTEASPKMGPWAMATWPADSGMPAFAGIDHVLVRALAVRGAERFTVPGTDHHGIVARLATCGQV